MRNELETIQLIEKYILNTLSKEQRLSFEKELSNNPSLQAEIDKQTLIIEAIKRKGLKKSVKKAKTKTKGVKITKFVAASLAVLGATALIYLQTTKNTVRGNSPEDILPVVSYKIDNSKDTVIETEAGLTLVIPENAFTDEKGNPVTGLIDFKIQEAFKQQDILKAGLTTLSNGQLLETGGMFNLKASINGKELKLASDKQILAEIPNYSDRDDMMLYDGEKKADGSVNWVNPKKFEKDLITYDITSLDFYPEGYPQEIQKINSAIDITNKSYTDSVYYSYGRLFSDVPKATKTNDEYVFEGSRSAKVSNIANGFVDPVKWTYDYKKLSSNEFKLIFTAKIDNGWMLYSKDNTKGIGPAPLELSIIEGNKILYDFKPSKKAKRAYDRNFQMDVSFYDNKVSFETIVKYKAEGVGYSLYYMVCNDTKCLPPTDEVGTFIKKNSVITEDNIFLDSNAVSINTNGKALFNANCASCHHPIKDLTGPALRGARAKWEQNGDDIYAWVKNPQAQYDAGVKSALDIQYNPGGMNGIAVSNDEIDAILDYADGLTCTPSGINPSKIKAIWNKKFNNTILATKEFEERLVYIHKEHSDQLLYVYTSNINKPLWYSDSIAAMISFTYQDKFEAFYKQKKGGVKISNRLTKKLAKYYKRKQEKYNKESSELHNDYQAKKKQLVIDFKGKKSAKQQEEANRKLQVLNEECLMNLKEAKRQLGYRKTRLKTLIAPISNLGWKNVDKAVFESTKNRTTLDYTDPLSGKKAVIKYEEASVTILNDKTFDRVFVYMIPDSLSSYNRMKSTDDINFKENLNELFDYRLVCIGYIDGESPYYYESKLVAKHYDIKMLKVSEGELNNKLKRKKSGVKQAMQSDINFYQEEKLFDKQQKAYKNQDDFTKRVGKFLFPDLNERCFVSKELNVRYEPVYGEF